MCCFSLRVRFIQRICWGKPFVMALAGRLLRPHIVSPAWCPCSLSSLSALLAACYSVAKVWKCSVGCVCVISSLRASRCLLSDPQSDWMGGTAGQQQMGKTLKLVWAFCYLCLVISLTLDLANIRFLGHGVENVSKASTWLTMKRSIFFPGPFW